MNISKKLLLLPFLSIFMVSCLTGSDQNQSANQLVLSLEFTSVNEEIIQGDTVAIDTLRFLYGRTTLQGANDTLLINDNTLQVTHGPTNDETKGLASGTFNADEVFTTLAFEIKQAEQSDTGSDSNFDEEAFIEGESEDQRYSMIINGSYNGNDFVYKSTRNFNFEFPIQDDSGGTQGNLFYNLPMKTDVTTWFLNEAGDGLLDPGVSENATAINDNIELSLNIEE